MNTFKHIVYNEKSINTQNRFKNAVEMLFVDIDTSLKSPRAKALALTNLEQCFMWIGKAIRDDQIESDNLPTDL